MMYKMLYILCAQGLHLAPKQINLIEQINKTHSVTKKYRKIQLRPKLLEQGDQKSLLKKVAQHFFCGN
jgi:hypothetical protein